MLMHRLKILASMIIALVLVEGYVYFTKKPVDVMAQATNIKGLLARIQFAPPNWSKLFTFTFPENNNSSQVKNGEGSMDFITSAPVIPPTKIPTPIQNQIPIPTYGQNLDATPTSPIYVPPTSVPVVQPTKVPKPTAVPKAPPVTSATRPGTSLAEIFDEVSKRECIPAALLHAFQTQETGPFFNYGYNAATIKIYNTYGWWTDGTGNSCAGMGYHTQTGIVPPDAADAGTVCQNAIPSGADQGIMGIMQISQYEQDAVKKTIATVIKGSYDRRVLFDNTVIFAIITKNRLGTPPSNCNDWPDDAIKTAAEKHYGNCSANYCTNILKYYKQYK